MTTLIGGKAPAFEVQGSLHGKAGAYKLPHTDGKWTLLMFYPEAFSAVCPTEMIALDKALGEFKELNTVCYGVSVDPVEKLTQWTQAAPKEGGVGDIGFVLLSDVKKDVSEKYQVLKPNGVAARGTFVIDPDGTILAMHVYNNPIARSIKETLRALRAFQHLKTTGELCPVDWEPGADSYKSADYKTYAAKHY